MAAENLNIFVQSLESLINSVTYRGVFLNGVRVIMSKMRDVTNVTNVKVDKDGSLCGSHPYLHGGLC